MGTHCTDNLLPSENDGSSIQSLPSNVDTEHADDGINKFHAVIEQADLKAAARLATRVRIQQAKLVRSGALRRIQIRRLSCKVLLSSPEFGSYNILLPVRFRDGVQWFIKIPSNGSYEQWDEESSRALTSEVLTMKLLYNNSTLPVPRIHSFDATTANLVKAPFTLMDRIDGTPLYYGWFFSETPAKQDRLRERAVDEVAKAMVQLNAFTFPKAGALEYNHGGKELNVGPYSKVDHYAARDRMISGLDRMTNYSQHGPFADPKDYFLTSLNADNPARFSCRLQGMRKLLRLFIHWLFQATSEDSEFVLAHPDFDLQNILVGKDGSLRGFVDWDGVVAVPRCIGCEGYPLWLTSDWDPTWWNYNADEDRVIDEEKPAMSPKELNHYRGVYAQSIEAALGEQWRSSQLATTCNDAQHDQHAKRSRTKISPLARSLYTGANEPEALHETVAMIFKKVAGLTSGENFAHIPAATASSGVNSHGGEAGHSAESMLGATDEQEPVVTWNENDAPSSIAGRCEEVVPVAVAHESEPGSGVKQKSADEPTEATVTISHDSRLCIEGIAVDITWSSFSQQQPWQRSTSTMTWQERLWSLLTMVLAFLLSLPAFFMFLMDWLQSGDVSSIYVTGAAPLFSEIKILSRSTGILLFGLFFARLVDQVFQRPSQQNKHGSKRSGHQGDRGPCPRTIENISDSEHQSLALSSQTPKPTSVGPWDGGQEVSNANAGEKSLTTPSDALHEPGDNVFEAKEGNGDHDGSNSSRSSKDSLSDRSVKTNITVPTVGSGSDHGNNATPATSEERLNAIGQKWEEDPTHDFGSFTQRNVYNALYKDSLDAVRLRRLKVGFQRLLASLDDRFANFDGLTLSDG